MSFPHQGLLSLNEILQGMQSECMHGYSHTFTAVNSKEAGFTYAGVELRTVAPV